MVSQSRRPQGFGTTMQRNGWIAQTVILSCFFVWLFFILFNELFFVSAPSVLDAIFAYEAGLLLVGIVLATLLFITKFLGHSPLPLRALQMGALCFALACCGVRMTFEFGLIGPDASDLLMTFSAAVSIALFAPAVLSLLGSLTLQERIASFTGLLALSAIAFILVLLIPFPALRLCAISVVLAIGALVSFFAPRPKINQSSLQFRFGERLRTALALLLFGGGFLCSYELNAMQKTTHFITSVPEQFCLGGTSLASLLAIGLTIVLLCLLVREIRHPVRSLAVLVFAMILLGIYYCLPIMSNQKSFPVSFVLILALGCTVLLLAVFLFLEPSGSRETNEGKRLGPLSACIFTTVGALGGALLAYGLMERLDTVAFMPQVLSFLPAVLIFSLIGVLLFFRKELLAVVQPPQAEPTMDKLDTSSMDGRCQLFAQKYHLTKRETEVLKLISQGRNIPGIAEALVVSQATAKTHLLHVYKKVGVSSRQELIDVLYGDDSKEA